MKEPTVASPNKVTWHQEKVMAYCRGEPIYPATLELDLTSRCTRTCENCPSSRSRFHSSLEQGFVDRLLGVLGGHTRGLLLTGGEPTMSDLFPWTLSEARRRGFEEIAVVTNGSLLHQDRVYSALLEHASTIRLSLYDWADSTCSAFLPTLRKIEELRHRIDDSASSLKIGISLLTSADRSQRLIHMAETVRDAGAHWVYFHPVCLGWGKGVPVQVSQNNVIPMLHAWRESLSNGFQAHWAEERYSHSILDFDGYHGAHFLLIIGADGLNYLGAEVKYQPDFVLADVAGDWSEDFLWRPGRLARIAAVTSGNYTAIGSRHRGALYSHVLETLKKNPPLPEGVTEPREYRFPHIL